jgi:hypothetical protein
MGKLNIKSLIFGIILGFANWLWAFIIVGSAFYNFVANRPVENFNIGYYIAMLIVNAILSILVFALYLWKYEEKNPIIPDKWAIDAIALGGIICGMNFLFDALVFGMMGRNLIAYFWLETTTGYLYPIIILLTYILAYLIYGKKQ